MPDLEPTLSTVKTLFALSCNVCAIPACEMKLADPAWRGVQADIAHIHGKRPSAPRYDPSMTDDDRRSFDNLLLVCPNHHRLIDLLNPDDYTAERLRQIKATHEGRCAGTWATDEQLSRYATLLIVSVVTDPTTEPEKPILTVEVDGNGNVEVHNTGTVDALRPEIEPLGEKAARVFVSAAIPPNKIPPGGRWRAGQNAPSLADGGPFELQVRWHDDAGNQYAAEFQT